MKKNTKTPFYILIFGLLCGGVALCLYRYFIFDIPLLPGEKRQVWSLEAKISFKAKDEPVLLAFALPGSQPGFRQIAEHSASPGYGLAYVEQGRERHAEWSIRQASGRQVLYYRVDMLRDENWIEAEHIQPPSVFKRRLTGEGPHNTQALNVLRQAEQKSADAYTLARELIRALNAQQQTAQLLSQKRPLSAWVVDLLAVAGVPAREVQVLNLEDGRRRQKLMPYVQVFKGGDYWLFDLKTGLRASGQDKLMWEYQSSPLLELTGGSGASVTFSIIKQEIPVLQLQGRNTEQDETLFDLSIHSLPLEEQTLFKGILLIPIGVLVVVFLRLFVGVKTSGTFMPVLIAIAFIQTTLITGLIGFVLVVGTGLILRGYLSQHNLLLVARISVVIISVIILISLFTVVSYQLGLTDGLKITFFPMIILSWTIERMSILWEEEGPKEVLLQTSGSLFVAVVAYTLMQSSVIQHLTFNFIGLQFILMALLLLMGSYKGYRLSELMRFAPLSKRKASE